jgi:hypothetical protein
MGPEPVAAYCVATGVKLFRAKTVLLPKILTAAARAVCAQRAATV